MSNASRSLYRLPSKAKISGVCAGLAEYFGFDVTLMRLIFVLLAFITGGTMVLIYIVLAIILPVSDNIESNNDDTIGEKVQRFGKDLRENGAISRARNYFGAFLLIFGSWLLVARFMPQIFILHWDLIWPVILVFVVLLIIIRKKN